MIVTYSARLNVTHLIPNELDTLLLTLEGPTVCLVETCACQCFSVHWDV